MRVRKFTAITPLSESARKSVNSPTGRVFKGVTLIKAGLGNRRDKNFYPPEALKEGVASGLFEGLRAFADHPDSVSEEIQPERSIRDMVGVYENATYDDGAQAVKADLRILRSHSWLSDAIDELIEAGHGDKIGLSINGRGETEPVRRQLEEAGGEVEVNELKRFIELRSTDVVTEAGAGGGFAQLVESARRARESATMSKPMKSELYKQLREAVRKGEVAKAKELEAKIDSAEGSIEEAEDGDESAEADGKKGGRTREMGAFATAGKPRRRMRAAYEADADEQEQADDEESDEVDEAAALDEAADDLRASADGEPEGDEADDEGEDGDDLDEADDEGDEADDEDADETQESAAPGVSKFRAAARESARRTREGTIKGGLGPKTGSVKSGVGKFTTRAKTRGSGSRMSTKTTMGFKTGRRPGSARESASYEALRMRLDAAEQKNRRLTEAVARQQSINLATKLLKESALPPAVRPHVLRDLVGLSKQDMLAEINKQVSILEAAVEGASARFDDFDVVEGAGATTIREGRYGSRDDDGDGLGDILSECGLPMKRG